MKHLFNSPEEKKIFLAALLLSLTLIIILTIAILTLNSGLFVYIVDDSYIHLALAENIIKCHYGVNLNEYSSPSSSILWPLLLTPFSGFGFGLYIPFIINIFSVIGTLYVFLRIVEFIFPIETSLNRKMNNIQLLFMILLTTATNLIGSIFGGMEHTFQVFVTVIIILGLINEIKNKEVSNWLIVSIIIAPLIRYENLALSLAAPFFLYFRGYKKKSVISFSVIIILLGAFSFFLLSLGLKPLPLSILAKLSFTSSDGSIISILNNFLKNIFSPRCALLFTGMLFLFGFIFFPKRNKEEKLIAVCIAVAILFHLLFSRDGRYVVYIWTATVLVFLFLYRHWLLRTFLGKSFFKSTASAIIIVLIVSYNYIYGTIMIPVASNNIYEQQYQMHRFATEFYKKPVAVNDLGYVTFKNDNYVLDLVGLASMEVQDERKIGDWPEWMNKVTRRHNVKFAMIYDRWFYKIPANWEKVAELYLSKIKISPAENVVAFYILDKEIKNEITPLLRRFKSTLPDGVMLVIKD